MTNLLFLILGIIVLAIVAIVFFSFLANRYTMIIRDKRLEEISEGSPYRDNKPKPKKTDDHLAKNKIKEKQEEQDLENAVMKYDPLGQSMEVGGDDSQIVGVAEPVGFWTRFVMKQKLGFIVARTGLQSSKKGYWANLIKAQAASQGKEQGKGR
jgi:hypothetical protein